VIALLTESSYSVTKFTNCSYTSINTQTTKSDCQTTFTINNISNITNSSNINFNNTNLVVAQSRDIGKKGSLNNLKQDTLKLKDEFVINENGKSIDYENECYFIFWGSYPPSKCGVGEYNKNMLTSISQQPEFNCKIEVIALHKKRDEYEFTYHDDPNPVHSLYLTDKEHSKGIKQATDYLNNKTGNIKLIMQHEYGLTPNMMHPVLFLAQLKPSIKSHVILHTPGLVPNLDQYDIIKTMSRLTSTLVTLSWHGYHCLLDSYKIEKEKIKFFPHGVNLVNYNEVPKINSHLIQENDFLILSNGIIGTNKGFDKMIKALKLLKDKNKLMKNMKFMIIGEISDRNAMIPILNLVKEYELKDHFIWLNKYVSKKQLNDYIRRADVFVSLYYKHESTSGTLLHAMGLGKAIISSAYKFAIEALLPDKGILIPTNDYEQLASSVYYLYMNRDIQKLLETNSLNYAKKIAWSRFGKSFLDYVLNGVYDSLVKEPFDFRI
jgi:glycosyltransferase involved in cell wall biosynthesis